MNNNEIKFGSSEYYKQILDNNKKNKKRLKKNNFLKFGLMIFFFSVFLTCTLNVLKFNDVKAMKNITKKYNMNLSESINLASLYDDKNVIWKSNNDNVEIKDNVATAVSTGSAHIVASLNDEKVFDVILNILDDNTSVSVANHFIYTSVGDKIKIEVNNNDSDNSLENTENGQVINTDVFNDSEEEDSSKLFYESSDEDIAKVDSAGNVETVSFGNVIISVSDSEGNKDFAYVNVISDSFSFNDDSINLTLGENSKIDYKLSGNSYSSDDIVWSSSDNNVITVDSLGNIKTVNVGEAIVTAKIDDILSDEIKVVVKDKIISPESLVISDSYVELVEGESKNIVFSVYPDDCSDKQVFWNSNNEDVVSVVDGEITANGVGKTIVTVSTVNGIKKEIEVVVLNSNVDVQDIVLDNDTIDMKLNEVKKIEYSILPDNSTNKNVIYSYDKNKVSIDSYGNIKAVSVGTTTVTISTSNGIKKKLVVNVSDNKFIPVSNFSLTDTNITLSVGETKTILSTIEPSNATNKDIVWSSSNSNIAKVDSNGNVTGVGAGSVVISAKCGNITRNVNVTVNAINNTIKVTSVNLNKTTLDLTIGSSSLISASVVPSNVMNKKIVWSSSNNKIAKVDQKGNVTGVGAGTAVISAVSSDNSSVVAKCTVVVRYTVYQKMDILFKSYNNKLKSDRSNGKHWVYTNSSKYAPQNSPFSVNASQSKNKLGANCATSANWVLKDMGVIKSNTKFYGDSNGKLKTNNLSDLKKNTNIYHYSSKTVYECIKEKKILPGDIICTKGHTFTYMGDYIFDSGRGAHGKFVGKSLGVRSEYYSGQGVFEFYSWIMSKSTSTYKNDLSHYKAYTVIRVKSSFKVK